MMTGLETYRAVRTRMDLRYSKSAYYAQVVLSLANVLLVLLRVGNEPTPRKIDIMTSAKRQHEVASAASPKYTCAAAPR